jgi:hypothetical protein
MSRRRLQWARSILQPKMQSEPGGNVPVYKTKEQALDLMPSSIVKYDGGNTVSRPMQGRHAKLFAALITKVLR